MTIKQLIEHLNEYPQDTTVLTYDPELEDLGHITGFLYDEKNKTLELCMDDTS